MKPPLPNRGGPQPRLSPSQRALVVRLVRERPTLNIQQICEAVELETGLRVSATTIRRCLKAEGFSKRAVRKEALSRRDVAAAQPPTRYEAKHRRTPSRVPIAAPTPPTSPTRSGA